MSWLQPQPTGRANEVDAAGCWAKVPFSMAAMGEPDTDPGERGKHWRTPPWAVPILGGPADALLIGIVAAVISAVGAGNPSFWYDEAATISGATRTLPELARLVKGSDA